MPHIPHDVIYRLLADVLIVIHLLFIVFVVCGGWLALRWRWMPWLHLPAAAWGAFVEFSGRVCPLTPLENLLRREAGLEQYAGSFVERYLLPILYPGSLTSEIQMALGVFVIVANVAAYTVVWRFRKRVAA